MYICSKYFRTTGSHCNMHGPSAITSLEVLLVSPTAQPHYPTTMTDLTVLVSPIPLYPETKEFTFGRRPVRPLTPIMVTLEREIDQAADEGASKPKSPVGDMDFINPPVLPKRRVRTPTIVDTHLLSPPANTWRSKPRHRPTRSQSAPPERRSPPAASQEDRLLQFSNLEGDLSAISVGLTIKRSSTATLSRPITRGGELVRPPPPLCTSCHIHLLFIIFSSILMTILVRPTTFWRKTRRSGVTGPSYSPSSHLIRRSTYIAAGLAFDAPIHDLSALCVESRIGFIVIPSDQLLQ